MRGIFFLLLCMTSSAFADTINNYMNIVNNIPKMEVQADPQAQAWARSARNILILTSETIGDTLKLANEAMQKQGAPLFCLPAEQTLNADMLNNLIQQTYRDLSSQPNDKDQMTVSQVALLGIQKRFPCADEAKKERTQMEHQSALDA